MKAGGLGHYSAELLSPISFCSAYAHHAFLDKGTLDRLLQTELTDTVQRLGRVVPEYAMEEHVSTVIDIGLHEPIRKVQRELTRAAHGLARTRLLESIPRTPFGVRDKRVCGRPTDAWLPFFIAPTS